MSIYRYLNYKDIIRNTHEIRRKSLGKSITFEALARACRVQKTYLSKVLNHDANLNCDQLYRASQFLGLSEPEREFLFLVYNYQTTEIPELKKVHLAKIQKIREAQKLTESNLQVKTKAPQEEQFHRYYLDPNLQLIHMFLTVERFSVAPELIQQELNLPPVRFQNYLQTLAELRIIEFASGRWKVIQDDLHLTKNSIIFGAYRNQMRLKSLEQMDRVNPDSYYSFSVLFSSEPAIFEKIKEEFLVFLKNTQGLVGAGRSDQVYQMNFDLLPWS